MLDIILMNLIFWPTWILVSYIPQYVSQKIIDTY